MSIKIFQIPADGRNLQTGTKIPRGPRLEHAEENHANYRKKNKVSRNLISILIFSYNKIEARNIWLRNSMIPFDKESKYVVFIFKLN